MGLTEDDLARAYRENAEHARKTNEEWTAVCELPYPTRSRLTPFAP